MHWHSSATALAVGVALAAAALLPSARAAAQDPEAPVHVPPRTDNVSLSGPRFGVTYLSDGIVEYLADNEIDVSGMVTQFGWQFEKQFYAGAGGPTAVTEWVLLVGGLEQGAFLPSLSWLVGLRTERGAELGVGPNITPAGAALAMAAGVTMRMGALNIPINLAVVPSKRGMRVSVLTGFSMRR